MNDTRGCKRIDLTTTMYSSLSQLWSVVAAGQFGIISAAAMARLTHGAVALPVIMGQRSEATPYHTIHRQGHTPYITCALPQPT